MTNKIDIQDKVFKFQRALQLAVTDANIVARIEIERDNARRCYEFNVIQDALADKRDFEYKHPANCFEALKEAVLPKSMQRFVKYKTISFIVLYPDFEPLSPNYTVHSQEND